MRSLSTRLLISVSVLLLLFFGATIFVLDTAFSTAGEQARRDILDGHLVQLLAAANPNEEGALSFPPDMHEERFNTIGSGLFGELRDDSNDIVWRSRSSLGLELPVADFPELGYNAFGREALADGTPLLTLSLAVQWEFPDGELKPYVFKVAESLDSFNAQVAGFRRQLIGWFAAIALIMLLSISILMRGLLKPLRQIETEIGEIEEGKRVSLSEKFPTELAGVARNMNLLIDNERARSDRYRYTQIDRMDEIVRYQLRKPAASVADNLVLTAVPVGKEVERLASGLRKVYHDKQPLIETDVAQGMQFRGDTGDFLEVAGNLLDNACKWCESRVKITVTPSTGARAIASGMILTVDDDGPGIPEEAAEALLERGTRLDEATPGHGIGLAIVKDIARSYGGKLKITRSDLGGAKITVSIPPVPGPGKA
jgi:two-component system sensor histidine kinase PhoQ